MGARRSPSGSPRPGPCFTERPNASAAARDASPTGFGSAHRHVPDSDLYRAIHGRLLTLAKRTRHRGAGAARTFYTGGLVRDCYGHVPSVYVGTLSGDAFARWVVVAMFGLLYCVYIWLAVAEEIERRRGARKKPPSKDPTHAAPLRLKAPQQSPPRTRSPKPRPTSPKPTSHLHFERLRSLRL